MIKRIIIDIDNTLIEWKEAYSAKIEAALQGLNIDYTKQEVKKIQEAFDAYELAYLNFNQEQMTTFINGYTGKSYPKGLVENCIGLWSECVPDKPEEELIEVLSYLKSKYELVVLTDWFVEPQRKRLGKMGIDFYFNKIYGADEGKRKPYPEAFEKAMENCLPEECVMIGDNLERDIKGAIAMGIQPIWYHPQKIKKEKTVDFQEIQSWRQLKSIL